MNSFSIHSKKNALKNSNSRQTLQGYHRPFKKCWTDINISNIILCTNFVRLRKWLILVESTNFHRKSSNFDRKNEDFLLEKLLNNILWERQNLFDQKKLYHFLICFSPVSEYIFFKGENVCPV